MLRIRPTEILVRVFELSSSDKDSLNQHIEIRVVSTIIFLMRSSEIETNATANSFLKNGNLKIALLRRSNFQNPNEQK